MRRIALWIARILAVAASLVFGLISIAGGYAFGFGGAPNLPMMVFGLAIIILGFTVFSSRRWTYLVLLGVATLAFISFGIPEHFQGEFADFFEYYVLAIVSAQIIALAAGRKTHP